MKKQIGLYVCVLLTAAVPAFAQAGGQVLNARMAHSTSPVSDRDHVFLEVFVVDAVGHPYKRSVEFNADQTNNFLAGGVERRAVLFGGYIDTFKELNDKLACGGNISTDGRIDVGTGQNYNTLACIEAAAKLNPLTPPVIIQRVEPELSAKDWAKVS